MGSSSEAEVTITAAFTHFLISPLMKISLISAPLRHPSAFAKPPQELVFKVYDGKFARSLRKYSTTLPVLPPTKLKPYTSTTLRLERHPKDAQPLML